MKKFFLLFTGLFLGFMQVDVAAQNRQSVEDQELIRARSAYIDGLAAFENENYQQALELLQAAYVKLPDHAGVNFALADAYLRVNDLANAEYYGNQAVKLNPRNQWYHLKLVNIYREAGKSDAVIEELYDALKYHPNNNDLLYELAQSYSDYGKLLDANNIYSKLLYLEGEDIGIRLQRMKNFNDLNMRDSAIVELQKIRELDPDNLSTLQVLSNYYLEMNRQTEAKEVLQQALSINERDPQTLIMLSNIYMSEAKWDSLEITLGNVASDSSVSVDDKLEIARHLYMQFTEDTANTGLRGATSTVFEKLMESTSESSEVQALAADFFVKTSQHDLALQALEHTTELMPTGDNAWHQRLQLLLMEGKTKEAITIGERAAEIIPQDPIILYFLGSAQLAQQQYDKAIKNLEEANTLPVRRPLKANILGSLGNAYAGLKNLDEAFEYYGQSLKLNPDNAGILNNYAYYLSVQQENLPQAQKMARRAVDLDPDNPSYLDTLGWVYYQQGAYKKAEEYIRAALNTGRASAEVMEHMGDLMDKLDNKQAAQDWWKKALEKDSTRTHLKEKISK